MNKMLKCPHCGNDDQRMISLVQEFQTYIKYFCEVCSKIFEIKRDLND
jgi:DNA-directed RNA polymerase subunit RPC12/RpoP